MLVACLSLALMSIQPKVQTSDSLDKLCLTRGRFETSYRSPKRESLQVVENLGTTGLGNPYRFWYFPASSAKYRIWFVVYQGYSTSDKKGREISVPDSGAIVYQSWHGNHTTTDWVLPLKVGKAKNPAGTLEKLITVSGFKVAGKTTKAQLTVLHQSTGMMAFTQGRMDDPSAFYCWWVDKDGRDSKTRYVSDYHMLDAPPVLPEEVNLMGFKSEGVWHGPGKFELTNLKERDRSVD